MEETGESAEGDTVLDGDGNVVKEPIGVLLSLATSVDDALELTHVVGWNEGIVLGVAQVEATEEVERCFESLATAVPDAPGKLGDTVKVPHSGDSEPCRDGDVETEACRESVLDKLERKEELIAAVNDAWREEREETLVSALMLPVGVDERDFDAEDEAEGEFDADGLELKEPVSEAENDTSEERLGDWESVAVPERFADKDDEEVPVVETLTDEVT
jgi:hypothetical protein